MENIDDWKGTGNIAEHPCTRSPHTFTEAAMINLVVIARKRKEETDLKNHDCDDSDRNRVYRLGKGS